MKASDVMMIGRNQARAAATPASKRNMPCSSACLATDVKHGKHPDHGILVLGRLSQRARRLCPTRRTREALLWRPGSEDRRRFQSHETHLYCPDAQCAEGRRNMTMTERAVLAGGCFWGMQDLIRKLPGVD